MPDNKNDTGKGRCQFYISPDQRECGQPADRSVNIKTRLIAARIRLCSHHASEYAQASYNLRHANKERVNK